MNQDVQDDILRRLKALESTAVRYRAGEVTDISPLDVALGGSDVPYEDVRSIEANVTTGDHVGALVFGNDLLVLGRILGGDAWRVGAGGITWPGASLFSNGSFSVNHGLGRTPIVAFGGPLAPAGGFVFEVHAETVSSTAVQWRARTLDGTTPAAGTTKTFFWFVA